MTGVAAELNHARLAAPRRPPSRRRARPGRAATGRGPALQLRFHPSTIRLAAGRPIVLHLVNSGDGGHNFAAPEFFAAAQGVSGPVRRGRVEVAGHQSADIRLTPARGTYRLRCTHTLHTAFGMSGEIVVE